MVLRRNLGAREVQVVVDHLEGGVAQYLAEREDVATVKQIVDGKGMPAQPSAATNTSGASAPAI